MFKGMEPKTKKIFLIVGILLVIGVIVFFVVKSRRKKKKEQELQAAQSQQQITAPIQEQKPQPAKKQSQVIPEEDRNPQKSEPAVQLQKVMDEQPAPQPKPAPKPQVKEKPVVNSVMPAEFMLNANDPNSESQIKD